MKAVEERRLAIFVNHCMQSTINNIISGKLVDHTKLLISGYCRGQPYYIIHSSTMNNKIVPSISLAH